MLSAQRHIEAMDKIAALVNVRERTCRELRERLLKLGFTEEEVADALESAVRSGLVSEERYTRAYIRGKVALGWGRRKVIDRLQREGIDEALIACCEDEFPDEEGEYAMALKELSRRRSTSSDPYASYMRRLVNKGYGYEVAQRAVRAYLSEEGEG